MPTVIIKSHLLNAWEGGTIIVGPPAALLVLQLNGIDAISVVLNSNVINLILEKDATQEVLIR